MEMNAHVTIADTELSFDVLPGESILDAALRAGARLRYGCRRGKCSTCKHYVVSGDVDDSRVSAYALLDEERDEGATLLCQAFPRGDCVIELSGDAGEDDGVALLTPLSVEGSFTAVVPLSRSIWSVTIDLDAPLPSLAGQYVELEVPGLAGVTRAYSLASPPSSPQRLELAVKRIPGGTFSGQLETLPGQRARVNGPFGQMYLRPGTRPLVLVGAGSGIGPLIGILRALAETDPGRPTRLFYGARTVADLPYQAELARLAEVATVEVDVTLSQPETGTWEGPVGRVTTLLGRRFGDDPDVDAYVCGSPELCDDVTLLLEARGVPGSRIHVDGFYAAS
jgi:propane monooxygenase reductase subunit